MLHAHLGIFLVYTLSGVLLLLGFDLVFEMIRPSISRWWNQPNIAELGLQIVVGTLLLVCCFQYKSCRCVYMTFAFLYVENLFTSIRYLENDFGESGIPKLQILISISQKVLTQFYHFQPHCLLRWSIAWQIGA